MRILYDYSMFSMQRYGGVLRYVTELISRIADMPDSQVSVMMGLYLSRYGLEKHRNQFERFAGIRRPWIPGTHDLAHWMNAKWFNHFATDLEFDIYHSTYFFESDRRQGIQNRVVTVHDMIHDLAPGMESLRAEDQKARHDAIRSASGVICISEYTRRDVIKVLGIEQSKLSVIHHGRPARVEPTAGRIVRSPYLLFIGIRPKYKNFELLLQAFAKASQINRTHELILFGGTPLQASELQLAESLGVGDRMRRLPGGSDAVLANLYSNAAALVYPSRYEGFGMPILEAFTYDCPVVCSNATSLPEVGGDAALYFNPTDAEELSIKITQIIEDRDLRQNLVAVGRQRLEHFSWDRCAQETMAFYRQIAGAQLA